MLYARVKENGDIQFQTAEYIEPYDSYMFDILFTDGFFIPRSISEFGDEVLKDKEGNIVKYKNINEAIAEGERQAQFYT